MDALAAKQATLQRTLPAPGGSPSAAVSRQQAHAAERQGQELQALVQQPAQAQQPAAGAQELACSQQEAQTQEARLQQCQVIEPGRQDLRQAQAQGRARVPQGLPEQPLELQEELELEQQQQQRSGDSAGAPGCGSPQQAASLLGSGEPGPVEVAAYQWESDACDGDEAGLQGGRWHQAAGPVEPAGAQPDAGLVGEAAAPLAPGLALVQPQAPAPAAPAAEQSAAAAAGALGGGRPQQQPAAPEPAAPAAEAPAPPPRAAEVGAGAAGQP
jgi:hypothetical protein